MRNLIRLIANNSKHLIIILSVLGILLSCYLWYMHVAGILPRCTFSTCEDVLSGKYGAMFGVPVAAYGAAFYVAGLVLTFQRFFIKDVVLVKMFTLWLVFGLIYTLYLRYLEFTKLHAWCEWCWMSVLILLFISIVYVVERRYERVKNVEKI